MIRKNFVSLQMQRSTKLVFLLLVTAVLFLGTGCSASKKNSCGCPNKKGMVGY
jgi:predicted component of type VI protein secretion system